MALSFILQHPVVANREKYAFIIAVEDYQKNRFSKVDYAGNDALLVERVFREALGVPSQNIQVCVNSDATLTALQAMFGYQIHQCRNAEVYVYYAGHGFFSKGSNLLTAFDTFPENLEATSISLKEVILDRVLECEQLFLFLDTCSEDVKAKVQGRVGIADLSRNLLETYEKPSGNYAFYLSCSPGERAYPCDLLKHGIWTYHLCQALLGKVWDPGLFHNNQVMTETTLRNYLATAVPAYITTKKNILQCQNPIAIIRTGAPIVIASVVALTPVVATPVGEFVFDPNHFHFRGDSWERYSEQPEFRSSGRHRNFTPERHSEAAQAFAERLMHDQISEECKSIRERCRTLLGLRLSELPEPGVDSLDTPPFRYYVDVRQSDDDPGEILIRRELYLRKPLSETPDSLSQLFDLNELVFLEAKFPKKQLLLAFLEKIADAVEARVDEWNDSYSLSLSAPRSTFYFDQVNSELTFQVHERMTFQAMHHAFVEAWNLLCNV